MSEPALCTGQLGVGMCSFPSSEAFWGSGTRSSGLLGALLTRVSCPKPAVNCSSTGLCL